MNWRAVARALWRLLALVVLAASGTYLLIYLYRWEWNRALVSGLFFVAAEVVLAAETILARLRRLERRFEEEPWSVPPPPSKRPEGETGRASPFRWLDPGQGVGVFIPVLMGVGVVLSAIAYLVERLAASTTSAGEQGIARRMAALDPPPGGLVPPTADRPPPANAWDLRRGGVPFVRAAGIASAVVAIAVFGLLVGGGLNVLADWTMNRPDPDLRGRVDVVEMAIATKGQAQPPAQVAAALWVSCRSHLPEEVRASGFSTLGPHRVRFTLHPAIGHNARRRFQGCLQDATLDLVQATVTRFEEVPS